MMKQYLIWKVKMGIISLLLMICLTSCNNSLNRIDMMEDNDLLAARISETPEDADKQDISLSLATSSSVGTETMSETLLALETAMDVLMVIKMRDYQLLAKYAHPEKGIVFSSNAFVDYDEDLVFKAEQIKEFEPDIIYNWGYYESCDIPLKLTVSEYFDCYVYKKDFVNCRQIGINSIIRSGNCPENVAEIFPNSIFIEFHDEGTKKCDQLDWASLKIVLEKYNGNLKVIALISSNYVL